MVASNQLTIHHHWRRPNVINLASRNLANHFRKCGRQKDVLQYPRYLATVLSAGRTVFIRGNRLFGTTFAGSSHQPPEPQRPLRRARGVELETNSLYTNLQL